MIKINLFLGLPNLEVLNLEGNDLAGLDKSVFSSLVTVKEL